MSIVAIIGSDGSGKTTQAKMLVERLNNRGYEAIYVRPIFIIFDIIKKPEWKIWDTGISPRRNKVINYSKHSGISLFWYAKKMILGVLGTCYAFISYLILLLLSRNKIVVCDRFFYQFFFDLFGTSYKKIINIFPKPDMCFLLTGDINLLYNRMTSSFDKSVDKKYYSDVIKMQEYVCDRFKFIKVNINKADKKEINDIILSHLLESLENHSKNR